MAGSASRILGEQLNSSTRLKGPEPKPPSIAVTRAYYSLIDMDVNAIHWIQRMMADPADVQAYARMIEYRSRLGGEDWKQIETLVSAIQADPLIATRVETTHQPLTFIKSPDRVKQAGLTWMPILDETTLQPVVHGLLARMPDYIHVNIIDTVYRLLASMPDPNDIDLLDAVRWSTATRIVHGLLVRMPDYVQPENHCVLAPSVNDCSIPSIDDHVEQFHESIAEEECGNVALSKPSFSIFSALYEIIARLRSVFRSQLHHDPVRKNKRFNIFRPNGEQEIDTSTFNQQLMKAEGRLACFTWSWMAMLERPHSTPEPEWLLYWLEIARKPIVEKPSLKIRDKLARKHQSSKRSRLYRWHDSMRAQWPITSLCENEKLSRPAEQEWLRYWFEAARHPWRNIHRSSKLERLYFWQDSMRDHWQMLPDHERPVSSARKKMYTLFKSVVGHWQRHWKEPRNLVFSHKNSAWSTYYEYGHKITGPWADKRRQRARQRMMRAFDAYSEYEFIVKITLVDRAKTVLEKCSASIAQHVTDIAEKILARWQTSKIKSWLVGRRAWLDARRQSLDTWLAARRAWLDARGQSLGTWLAARRAWLDARRQSLGTWLAARRAWFDARRQSLGTWLAARRAWLDARRQSLDAWLEARRQSLDAWLEDRRDAIKKFCARVAKTIIGRTKILIAVLGPGWNPAKQCIARVASCCLAVSRRLPEPNSKLSQLIMISSKPHITRLIDLLLPPDLDFITIEKIHKHVNRYVIWFPQNAAQGTNSTAEPNNNRLYMTTQGQFSTEKRHAFTHEKEVDAVQFAIQNKDRLKNAFLHPAHQETQQETMPLVRARPRVKSGRKWVTNNPVPRAIAVALLCASAVVFMAGYFTQHGGNASMPFLAQSSSSRGGISIYTPSTQGDYTATPIVINGNGMLLAQYGSKGYSMIANEILNLNFTVTTGILVANTTEPLMISNISIADTDINTARGIVLDKVSNTNITGCILENCQDGIVLVNCEDIIISSCNLSSTNANIAMVNCSGITITGNMLSCALATNKTAFVQLAVDAPCTNIVPYDAGPRSGNFWSDYQVQYPRAKNDGIIWNETYTIAGVGDLFPLVNPFVPNVAPVVTGIWVNETCPCPGDPVEFDYVASSAEKISLQNSYWQFNDGSTEPMQADGIGVHAFTRTGAYTVTAVIATIGGVVANRTCTVTVVPAPGQDTGAFNLYLIGIILAGAGIVLTTTRASGRKRSIFIGIALLGIFGMQAFWTSTEGCQPSINPATFPLVVTPSMGAVFRLTEQAILAFNSTKQGDGIVFTTQNTGGVTTTNQYSLDIVKGLNSFTFSLDSAAYKAGNLTICVRGIGHYGFSGMYYEDAWTKTITIQKEPSNVLFTVTARKQYDYAGGQTYFSFAIAGYLQDQNGITILRHVVSLWIFNDARNASDFIGNCTTDNFGAFGKTYIMNTIYDNNILFTCTSQGDGTYLPAKGTQSIGFKDILSNFDIVDNYIGATSASKGPGNGTDVETTIRFYRTWSWAFGSQDFQGWVFQKTAGYPVIQISNSSMVMGTWSSYPDCSGYYTSPALYFGADSCKHGTITLWYRTKQYIINGIHDEQPAGSAFKLWLQVINANNTVVYATSIINGTDIGWRNATLDVTRVFSGHGWYYIRLGATVHPGSTENWGSDRNFWGVLYNAFAIDLNYSQATTIYDYSNSGNGWNDFSYQQRTAAISGQDVNPGDISWACNVPIQTIYGNQLPGTIASPVLDTTLQAIQNDPDFTLDFSYNGGSWGLGSMNGYAWASGSGTNYEQPNAAITDATTTWSGARHAALLHVGSRCRGVEQARWTGIAASFSVPVMLNRKVQQVDLQFRGNITVTSGVFNNKAESYSLLVLIETANATFVAYNVTGYCKQAFALNPVIDITRYITPGQLACVRFVLATTATCGCKAVDACVSGLRIYASEQAIAPAFETRASTPALSRVNTATPLASGQIMIALPTNAITLNTTLVQDRVVAGGIADVMARLTASIGFLNKAGATIGVTTAIFDGTMLPGKVLANSTSIPRNAIAAVVLLTIALPQVTTGSGVAGDMFIVLATTLATGVTNLLTEPLTLVPSTMGGSIAMTPQGDIQVQATPAGVVANCTQSFYAALTLPVGLSDNLVKSRVQADLSWQYLASIRVTGGKVPAAGATMAVYLDVVGDNGTSTRTMQTYLVTTLTTANIAARNNTLATPFKLDLSSVLGYDPGKIIYHDFELVTRVVINVTSPAIAAVMLDYRDICLVIKLLAPTVAIMSPASGQLVHGVVPIEARTNPDCASMRFQYSIDAGQNWLDINATNKSVNNGHVTWDMNWNTTGVIDDCPDVMIRAQVIDSSNLIASANITRVHVDNHAPTPSMSIKDHQIIMDQQVISISSDPDTALVTIEEIYSGNSWASPINVFNLTSTLWRFSLNLSHGEGTFDVLARARDAAGNVGSCIAHAIQIESSMDMISSPLNGTRSNGNFTLAFAPSSFVHAIALSWYATTTLQLANITRLSYVFYGTIPATGHPAIQFTAVQLANIDAWIYVRAVFEYSDRNMTKYDYFKVNTIPPVPRLQFASDSLPMNNRFDAPKGINFTLSGDNMTDVVSCDLYVSFPGMPSLMLVKRLGPTTGWNFSIDPRYYADYANYTFVVLATDDVGHAVWSNRLSGVYLNNEAPHLAIIAPGNGTFASSNGTSGITNVSITLATIDRDINVTSFTGAWRWHLGGAWQPFAPRVVDEGNGFLATFVPVNASVVPPCSLVDYLLRGADLAGSTCTVYGDFYFTNASDQIPPAISLIEPDTSITWSDINVPIQAIATDNVAVSHVQFFIDGACIADQSWNSSNHYGIQTSDLGMVLPPGIHAITARAFDDAGWTTDASCTITIGSASIAGIVNGGYYMPAGTNATVTFDVTTTMTDLSSLAAIVWRDVNSSWIQEATIPMTPGAGINHLAIVNTSSGTWGISLQAMQSGTGRLLSWHGNVTAPALMFTIDNSIPHGITIAVDGGNSLTNGSWIAAGVHELTFNSTCDVPIQSYSLYLDGNLYRTVDGTSRMSLDTAFLGTSGTHVLTIVANSVANVSGNGTLIINVDVMSPTLHVTAWPMHGNTIVTADACTIAVQATEPYSWIDAAWVAIDGIIIANQSYTYLTSISWIKSIDLAALGIGPGNHTITVMVTGEGGTTVDTIPLYHDVTPPSSVAFLAPVPGTAMTGTTMTLIANATDDFGIGTVAFYLGNPNASGSVFLGSGYMTHDGSWKLSCNNPAIGTNATLYARATDLVGNFADTSVSSIDLVAPLHLTCDLNTGDMYGSIQNTSGQLTHMDGSTSYQVSMYYQTYNATGDSTWLYVGSSQAIGTSNGGVFSISWNTDTFFQSGANSADFIPINITKYHPYAGIDIPNIGVAGEFNDTTNPIYAVIGQGINNHHIYFYQQVTPGTGQWCQATVTLNYSRYAAIGVATGDVDGDGLSELFVATSHEVLGIDWTGHAWSVVPLLTMNGITSIAFDDINKNLCIGCNSTVLVYHVTAIAAAYFTTPVQTVNAGGTVRSIDTGQLATITGQEVKTFFATDQEIAYFGSDSVTHVVDSQLSGVDCIRVGCIDATSVMTGVEAGVHVGGGRSVVVVYENVGTIDSPRWIARLVTDWETAVHFASMDVGTGIALAANINPSIIVGNDQNVTDSQLASGLNHQLIANMVSSNNPLYGVVPGTYNTYFIESIGASNPLTSYAGYEHYTSNTFVNGPSSQTSIMASGTDVPVTTVPMSADIVQQVPEISGTNLQFLYTFESNLQDSGSFNHAGMLMAGTAAYTTGVFGSGFSFNGNTKIGTGVLDQYSSCSIGGWFELSSDGTPGAPTNLNASVSGGNRINLTWHAPSSNGGAPIVWYNIYRGTATGQEIYLATVSALTYQDSATASGQQYYYQVSAINAVREGPRSSEIDPCDTGAVNPSPPSAPLDVQAYSYIPGCMAVSWKAPASDGGSSITGYNIYRGNASGAETFLISVSNVTFYNDTGIVAGITYCYQVSAINGAGEGALSEEAIDYTPEPPSAPQNPTISGGVLSWQAPGYTGRTPILGYIVYYGTAAGMEANSAGVGLAKSYSIAGFTGPHYFFVTAFNGDGEERGRSRL